MGCPTKHDPEEVHYDEASYYSWRSQLQPNTTLISKELSKIWFKVLCLYIGRRLTSAEDKLLAVAGVAARLSECTSIENVYLAGLWKATFIQELSWHRGYGAGQDTDSVRLQAPSWSWASFSAKVNWD